MHVTDLTPIDLPHFEIVAYITARGTVTLCVNRSGRCVLRAQVPVDQYSVDPITIDIGGEPARLALETIHEQS